MYVFDCRCHDDSNNIETGRGGFTPESWSVLSSLVMNDCSSIGVKLLAIKKSKELYGPFRALGYTISLN